MKALTLGQFLALPNAYVISVDCENIGHTIERRDVSQDPEFVGINEIISFTHRPTDVPYIYTFNADALIYIHSMQKDKIAFCQHTYTVESESGEKVTMELGFVSPLYPELA